ncbi:hypothetical protein C8J57DRAFT_1235243 [Mycena rebaudengoi]|nr:hypothetical protein C8J57DRAFT_1235243 [Mycena rebaudengoi]
MLKHLGMISGSPGTMMLNTHRSSRWSRTFKGGEITLLVELEQRIDGPGIFRDPESLLNTLIGEHECVGRNYLRVVSIKAAAVSKVGPSHAIGLDTVTIITPVSWANRVGADSSRVTAIAASPRLAEGIGALQWIVRDNCIDGRMGSNAIVAGHARIWDAHKRGMQHAAAARAAETAAGAAFGYLKMEEGNKHFEGVSGAQAMGKRGPRSSLEGYNKRTTRVNRWCLWESNGQHSTENEMLVTCLS